jgi:hypothetical protein
MKRIQDSWGLCALTAPGLCAGATKFCKPCPKLPDCYDPPGDATTQSLMRQIAIAWRDGRYVLVTVGAEFSLT